jgi:hypothetical protein
MPHQTPIDSQQEKTPEPLAGQIFSTPEQRQQIEKPEQMKEIHERPESQAEHLKEIRQETMEQPSGAPASAAVQQLPISAEEQRLQEIESVLSDGLQDIYKTLPPVEKQRFKIEGEKAAKEVAGLLSQVKVKVQQIISVIRRWLLVMPGVNKFFIEQEAKIKAERLLLLRDQKKI